jgi:hypothetical protein
MLHIYNFAAESSHITYIHFGFGGWDVGLTCDVQTQLQLQEILSEVNVRFLHEIESVELLGVFDDNVKFQFALP